jgi:hypothetical protein
MQSKPGRNEVAIKWWDESWLARRPYDKALTTILKAGSARRQASEGEMTIGEDRVRYGFNPGGNLDVEFIKRKTAELINECEKLKAKDPRLAALAQTAYEEAAMWAVKAATAP